MSQPDTPRTGPIVVSFVGPSTDLVPHTQELIPRYSEVMPTIAAALERGAALGIDVSGFESMCGIPLCLVPTGLSRFLDLATIPEGFDGGEFVQTEACQGCALTGRCFGLRRRYAALYGTDELRRVDADARPPIA